MKTFEQNRERYQELVTATDKAGRQGAAAEAVTALGTTGEMKRRASIKQQVPLYKENRSVGVCYQGTSSALVNLIWAV